MAEDNPVERLASGGRGREQGHMPFGTRASRAPPARSRASSTRCGGILHAAPQTRNRSKGNARFVAVPAQQCSVKNAALRPGHSYLALRTAGQLAPPLRRCPSAKPPI